MSSAGQLIRLKRAGHVFEVLTNPGAITAWRAKSDASAVPSSLCVAPIIFSNQSKGLRASQASLVSAFETDALEDCLRVIFEKGELQVSSSERQDKIDQ